MPVGGLERPDQDRGGVTLGLGDRVEQAVNAVGEVDVGPAGRAEEALVPRGAADVGVAGRVGDVVGLGLDDDAGGRADAQRAADQVGRDLVDRAVEEVLGKSGRGTPHAPLRRAGRRGDCRA